MGNSINKVGVVDESADRLALYYGVGVTRAQVKAALDALLDTVIEALAAGDSVRTDLGTFVVDPRAPRSTRNPRTGETVVVTAHRASKLRWAADVRREIAGT